MVGGLRTRPADAGLEGRAVAVAWRPGSGWIPLGCWPAG